MIATRPTSVTGVTSAKATNPSTGRVVELLPERFTGEALATWKQLDLEHPTRHVTASYPWVRAWIDAFGDTVSVRVAIWRDGQEIVGLGLVVRSENRSVKRVPLRTLHLGTTGEMEPGGIWAEHVMPWVRRDHEAAAFLEETLTLVAPEGIHRIDLDGVTARVYDAIGFKADDVERRDSPLCDLSWAMDKIVGAKTPPTRDVFEQGILDRLGKSTRKNLKRRLNRYIDLTTTWTDQFDEAVLEELIARHQARWQAAGQPGAFAERRFGHFIRQFLQLASGTDRYVLAKVKDASGTIGCQLLLREQGRVLDFLSGFVDADERPSPGLVCHYTNIVEAASRGLDGYEFLVGDARVKRDLSTTTRTICWAKQTRPTTRTRVLAAARRMAHIIRSVRRPANRDASPSKGAPS